MEAGQWRAARHGLPRPAADAGPRRADRIAAGSLPASQSHWPSATRPQPVLIDTTPIDDAAERPSARSQFEQVRRTADEPLFNSLMEEHHYLGYEQPVGEHLKYLVWAQGRPIACLAWSSAPASSGQPRPLHRLERGSAPPQHPLSRLQHAIPDSAVGRGGASGVAHSGPHGGADLSDDWQRMYGHPIYFLETFIDPERFRGTCYRAANWVVLGKTTGRGKAIQQLRAEPVDQRGSGISADTATFANC